MGLVNDNKQGHFLNEEQKKIKADIMNDLMEGIFRNLEINHKLFDYQSMLDLVFSILIMFNRDVLIHTITTFNLEGHRKQIMKDLFEQIKDQVNNKIKSSMV